MTGKNTTISGHVTLKQRVGGLGPPGPTLYCYSGKRCCDCLRSQRWHSGIVADPHTTFWVCRCAESQEFFQLFNAKIGIPQYAFQHFWMKCFRRVKRNGHAFAVRILEDHVAAALSCQRKSRFFRRYDNLSGGEARKPGHHMLTSTVETLTETCSGISSPSATRSSMCRRIASLMLARASLYVSPWL